MCSLNEFMFGSKGFSQVIATYSDREGGGLNLTYKLTMTVQANIQNANKKEIKKLVPYMTKEQGYDKCIINASNNTIEISSIDGLRFVDVLSYIRSRIDKNATEM